MLLPRIELFRVEFRPGEGSRPRCGFQSFGTEVTAEGAASQKLFEEFTEWCEDRSKDLGFEIKTGKSEIESLQALSLPRI